MANAKYNHFKAKIADGTIDLDTNTIKVMLVTSGYTPDIDLHHVRNDVTSEVANGNGYTTGGQALAGKSVTIDDTNDQGKFDANDLTWSSSSFTARGCVLYKDTGNITTDDLICYFDFGSDQTSSSGDFTIQWAAGGILTIS